jgi:hypothetical protein
MRPLLFLPLLLLLSACTVASAPPTTTPRPSPTPLQRRLLPTPLAPAAAAVWNDLEVSAADFELTAAYPTRFGTTRQATQDMQFLFVRLTLRNLGATELRLPEVQRYLALVFERELQATPGHRRDQTDYTDAPARIAPGEELTLWLRYEIPASATPADVIFAFTPESRTIGRLEPGAAAPWAEHPVYLWRLDD